MSKLHPQRGSGTVLQWGKTHPGGFRADPGSRRICVGLNCRPRGAPLPVPLHRPHTCSAKELSQDRREEKATQVLSPRSDF